MAWPGTIGSTVAFYGAFSRAGSLTMHEEHFDAPKRLYPGAVRQKMARDRVRQYLKELQRWQWQALKLQTLVQSARQTDDERLAVAAKLHALKQEIDLTRQKFLREMDDIREMPSVIDFLGALDRLIAMRF